jgi:hypothetical protein
MKRPLKEQGRVYPWAKASRVHMPVCMSGTIDRLEVITSVSGGARDVADDKAGQKTYRLPTSARCSRGARLPVDAPCISAVRDRRCSHPRRSAQCAHWNEAGRDVFGDEFMIERLRRARGLIGSVAVASEVLTGLDE